MPRILIERFKNSELNYIKESGVTSEGKHYIGRLEGPAADLINPTRNGRKYNLKLWRNVENSDDFKEGMETHTIFGEADHPEDRLETSIKQIAVCLRKFEIRESEGIVWCSFDILDTPNGRIIKELLDYGSKLGVSSRGSGEEITDEYGDTIIDPDTYLFICFDVVIMPAVKQARPTRVESKKLDNKCLIESIQTEIDNASTIQELNSMKSIIETSLPDNDSLIESINNKLTNISSGDNISSKLSEDLETSIKKCKELESINKDLKSKLSANNIRIKEMKNLIKSMKSNSHNLVESLRNCHSEIASYKDNIYECSEQYSECLDTISRLRKSESRLRSLNHGLRESLNDKKSELRIMEEKLDKFKSKLNESRHMISESRDDKNDFISENRKLSNAVSKYTSLNEKLNSDIAKANHQVSEYRSKNESLIKENKELMKNYIRLKSAQNGLSEDIIRNKLSNKPSITEVNNIVSNLSDKNDRINKMSINLESNPILDIKRKEAIDPETSQLTSILESIKK